MAAPAAMTWIQPRRFIRNRTARASGLFPSATGPRRRRSALRGFRRTLPDRAARLVLELTGHVLRGILAEEAAHQPPTQLEPGRDAARRAHVAVMHPLRY